MQIGDDLHEMSNTVFWERDGDDLHEMSKPVFWGKMRKTLLIYRLLK